MELALSLGGDHTSKPFKFLDDSTASSSSSSSKIIIPVTKDLGFCMGLASATATGFTSISQDNNKAHLLLHYNTHQDHDPDDHQDGRTDLPLQLDLLPFSSVPPSRPQIRFPWLSDNVISEPGSAEGSGGRGFDVKRLSAEETEEGVAPSSPNNSGASSFQMDIGITSNNNYYDNKRERVESIEGERGSTDDEDNINGLSRKKLRLSKDQSAFLEQSFKEHHTLNPKQKLALAKQLNLRPRQVEVWFQNRRARTKLKQTEVDCEYLKRCCETLTEDNKRLQKELQELRALKTSQPFYMQLPATTLTMCPSCERVVASSGTTVATAAAAATTTTSSTALSLASNHKPKLSYPSTSQAKVHLPQPHQAAS